MKISRLKEIREEKDLKQTDIAKVLKITQVQYSNMKQDLEQYQYIT